MDPFRGKDKFRRVVARVVATSGALLCSAAWQLSQVNSAPRCEPWVKGPSAGIGDAESPASSPIAS